MSDDKMPYGAMPPEPEEEIVEVDDTHEEPDKVEEPKQPEMDYKKSYEELRKKFGEHSNTVGELRKQNEMLSQQMAELQKEREKSSQPPPTDYEKMLAEVAERLDSGEISEKEALLQSNRITREWTKAEAEREKNELLNQARTEVQNLLAEKDTEQVVKRFYDANPDFKTMQESGAFEPLKQEDPLLDDLAAYWKAKAIAAANEKTAAFEQGKQEALRIKGGSERAGKVLADPGQSMQNQKPRGKMGEADIKKSMLAAINRGE